MRPLLQLAAFSLLLCCASASGDAPWRSTVASAGLIAPGQVEGAEQALASLPPKLRERAQALLGSLVQAPPGLDGVRTAYGVLASGLPSITSDKPTKGTDPAQDAVLGAAQIWFQGFLVQSGQVVAAGPDPVPHAAELLALVDSMELWSPGVRSTLRAEARRGLGDELYVQVLQSATGN